MLCRWKVFRQELQLVEPNAPLSAASTFRPSQPREKWLKRRTTIKLKVSERCASNFIASYVVLLTVVEGQFGTTTAGLRYYIIVDVLNQQMRVVELAIFVSCRGPN